MKIGNICMLLATLALMSGCMISNDPKISSVNIKDECGLNDGAIFQDAPYYISSEVKDEPISRLSNFFGSYEKTVDHVKIKKSGTTLSAQFYDATDKEVIGSRQNKERTFKPAGMRLIMDEWSSCKPGEAGVGCMWSHLELFCTQDNDLAIKKVRGGAGMIILVIPFWGSSSYIGLYKSLSRKN